MTRLKKISLLILSLALCFLTLALFTSCSDEDYENGVFYDGTTVIGADKDKTELVIRDGTTAIAKYAFSGCSELTSLTIPDSVKEVGLKAFDGCDKLIKTVNGIKYVDRWAVDADKEATEIVVSDGTVGIAEEAFARCNLAKSVIIPNSVKSICARSFFECNGLEKMTLPFVGFSSDVAYNTHFGYIFGAYVTERNAKYVPETLTEIKLTSANTIYQDAFSGCTKIKTVELPNTLTAIGARAFAECSALTGISIPDSVKSIGGRAFYKCSALSELKLPVNQEFTAIDEYTFAYCSSLVSTTVPEHVTSIGACAFARCTTLEEITISSPALTRVGQQAFDGCSFLKAIEIKSGEIEKGAFQNCTELKEVILGDNVTKIGEYAFNSCYGISSFTMSKNVSEIGKYAFYSCYSLTALTLPDSVSEILESTFQNCRQLKDFKIPTAVTSIGANAFSGCTALAVRGESVTTVDGWITSVIPATEILELDAGVRGFTDGALDGCVNITKINFNGTKDAWDKIKENVPSSILNSAEIKISTEASS